MDLDHPFQGQLLQVFLDIQPQAFRGEAGMREIQQQSRVRPLLESGNLFRLDLVRAALPARGTVHPADRSDQIGSMEMEWNGRQGMPGKRRSGAG
jgi:hypothetical protein